jgi:hypothetical protein
VVSRIKSLNRCTVQQRWRRISEIALLTRPSVFKLDELNT